MVPQLERNQALDENEPDIAALTISESTPKKKKPFAIWVVPLILPILFLVGWLLLSKQPHSGGENEQAFDFVVTTLDGGQFRLSQHRGKWVVVDFWSTLCGPCIEMLPVLEQFYQKNRGAHHQDEHHQGAGFEFIAIEINAAKEKIEEYKTEFSLSFPLGLGTEVVANEYHIDTVPTLFIIDPNGLIQAEIHGMHTLEELQKVMALKGFAP